MNITNGCRLLYEYQSTGLTTINEIILFGKMSYRANLLLNLMEYKSLDYLKLVQLVVRFPQ